MKKKILFLVENVTTAHFARSIYLANAFPEVTYDIYFASNSYEKLMVHATRKINFLTLSFHCDKAHFDNSVNNWNSPLSEDYFRKAIASDLVLIDEVKPSLVIGDFRLSLLVSAKKMNIPYLNLSNVCWDPDLKLPLKIPHHRWFLVIGDFIMRNTLKVLTPMVERMMLSGMNKVLVEHGVTPYKRMGPFHLSGDYAIMLDYPDLIERQKTHDKNNYIYIGPTFFSIASNNKIEIKKTMGSKNILVSMGSSGDLSILKKLLKYLEKTNYNVVILTAGRIQLSSDKPNITITDFYPFDSSLKNFDLMITNGGAPSNNAAFINGVISLMIPTNPDQVYNSSFIEEAGLGRVLESHFLSEKNLTKALSDLLTSSEVKNKILSTAEKYADFDSRKNIVTVVEKILQKGKFSPEKVIAT
ncbi:MAG: hypothetical protein K2Q18_01925 [Bdellovibrionales bacterium]|nr:hypothetical protein [Bdellovibrionales bacterium]